MKPEFTVEQIKEFVRNDYQSVAARMAKSALTHFEAHKGTFDGLGRDIFAIPSDRYAEEAMKAMGVKFADFDYSQYVIDHFRGCPGTCKMSADEKDHIASGLQELVRSILTPDYHPGSFIQALRSGKLYMAMQRADTINLQYFYLYINFIYREVPIHVLPPIMTII